MEKILWGREARHGNAVVEPVGGGYVVTGATESYGNGSSDVYLLKVDDAGNLLWQKAFGGAGRDEGRALLQASDGGYVIAGSSENGSSDILLIKTSPDGDIEWEKTYGGAYDDQAISIERTRDGGYILAGYLGVAADRHEAYLLKVDARGNMQWDQKFPANDDSIASYARQAYDRGYIAVGFTTNSSGNGDVCLMKTDPEGKTEWQKTYGGHDMQKGYNVYETPDQGYLIIGMAKTGSGLGLLIKTEPAGTLEWQKTYGADQDIFIRTGIQTDDGGLVLMGSSGKKGDDGTGDIYLLKIAGMLTDDNA